MAANGTGQAVATITAQNSFTDAVAVGNNDFAVSVSGISNGSTVTLQRRLDGTNWRDVKQYTADIEETGSEVVPGADYQLGVKTSDYGSGDTITAALYVG